MSFNRRPVETRLETQSLSDWWKNQGRLLGGDHLGCWGCLVLGMMTSRAPAEGLPRANPTDAFLLVHGRPCLSPESLCSPLSQYMCACPGAHSCPVLHNPMDCSPPGSSDHGISQATILEQVSISYFRGSSQSRDGIPTSCVFYSGRQFSSTAPPRKPYFTTHTGK